MEKMSNFDHLSKACSFCVLHNYAPKYSDCDREPRCMLSVSRGQNDMQHEEKRDKIDAFLLKEPNRSKW